MGKKQTGFKTKGMNRDLSVSAFNPEFSFENMNLRLSTNDGNTLMSWVTERGTKEMLLQIDPKPWPTEGKKLIGRTIEGTPIGTAIINHQLVLFTTSDGEDYIYLLWLDADASNVIRGKILYKGYLGFSISYPIETQVSYEAEHIQKVYWTDGKNQPRVINVAASEEKLKKWNSTTGSSIDTFFDFVPSIEFSKTTETIDNSDPEHPVTTETTTSTSLTVTQDTSASGTFAPGVIQYCFTYVNKNSQESNIVCMSPLFYISNSERGASPEETVSNAFTIVANGLDSNFDYVRLYSIQRTSLNSEPYVKLLSDIPIEGTLVSQQIERTYAYKEEGGTTSYTLPRDSNGKIESVTVENGTCTVTIPDVSLILRDGTSIQAQLFSPTSSFTFVGYNSDSDTPVELVRVYDPNPHDDIIPDIPIEDQDDDTPGGDDPIIPVDVEIPTDTEEQLLPNRIQQQAIRAITITIQDIIDNSLIDGYKGSVVNYYYHTAIQIEKLEGILDAAKSAYNKTYWGIQIGGNIIAKYQTTENNTTVDHPLSDAYISYDYTTKKWKISSTTSESETPVTVSTPNTITYVDNGTTGSTLDPTALLYVGGKEISVQTMMDKDSTLFLGNITEKNNKVSDIQNYFDGLRNTQIIEFTRDDLITPPEPKKTLVLDSVNGYYGNTRQTNEESNRKATTFKGGETYRFGIQLQKYTGEWSDPIFINDVENTCYPNSFVYSDTVNLPYAKANINLTAAGIDSSVFKRIRPVIVYPNIQDRSVLCQGVLNPTVFNALDRYNGIPFAQASWAFRPYMVTPSDSGQTRYLTYRHYEGLYTQEEGESNGGDLLKVEIQGSKKIWDSVFPTSTSTESDSSEETPTEDTSINTVSVGTTNTQYFVDQSIITLNSPDIEFDTEVQLFRDDNLKLRIVGAIPITASNTFYSVEGDEGTNIESLDSIVSIKNQSKGSKGKVGFENPNISAGNRLVAGDLWTDNITYTWDFTVSSEEESLQLKWKVFPWQADLSNLSYMPWCKIKRKKEASLLYSFNTEFFTSHGMNAVSVDSINTKMHLTENSHIYNIRLPQQLSTSSEINYYPNIDELLYNEGGYSLKYTSLNTSSSESSTPTPPQECYATIPIRYKSTSHAVVALSAVANGTDIPLLPSAYIEYILVNGVPKYEWDSTPTEWETEEHHKFYVGKYTIEDAQENTPTFWEDTVAFSQAEINIRNLFNKEYTPEVSLDAGSSIYETVKHNFLWLGELYRDDTNVNNRFGGDTPNVLKGNTWLVAGDTLDIPTVSGDINDSTNLTVYWTEGDTYYQRYDCLKTYAFTPDDLNQNVEVLSFMCETHVNLEGRYDKNIGQLDNTNVNPTNFNLLNPVYSQKENFFQYRMTDREKEDKSYYPNLVYFTKTKESGADVDLWTNVTLASTLELDGDKGEIKKLARLNDSLLAFQDTGISQILYNENVAIASTEGVPIELANSGKVQGKRYISNTIGCSNKWSMVTTPSGIYFMDSHDKNIYLFNGQLNNLSGSLGFNSWCKENIPPPSVLWNPSSFENFVAYYDRQNQDVLFINKEKALAYSERTGAFTSFYSYGDAPYFVNLEDTGLWISKPKEGLAINYKIWQHNAGDYCKFFDKNEPYWMTLVGNPEPLTDKIFTNLEFRASLAEEGIWDEHEVFTPYIPFDYLETWDEYQHGIATLSYQNGIARGQHHLSDGSASLNRKFRIWRCDIPRDNWPIPSIEDEEARFLVLEAERKMGITRHKARPLDRMRNMWVYMKLRKENATNDSEVTTHNQTVTGAAWEGKEIPESDPTAYYTKETANKYNTEKQIGGAWMYGQSLPKAEIHDVVMTYFN